MRAETAGDRRDLMDRRIAAMTAHYVDHYMAALGPFVSSVFFALIFNSKVDGTRPDAYIRSVGMSLAGIAERAGISKRKGIDVLAVLKDHGIIIQRGGRGRGNMNRYYFLPCETWLNPGDVQKAGGMGQ